MPRPPRRFRSLRFGARPPRDGARRRGMARTEEYGAHPDRGCAPGETTTREFPAIRRGGPREDYNPGPRKGLSQSNTVSVQHGRDLCDICSAVVGLLGRQDNNIAAIALI